jgi:hypothetical protein
LTTLVATHLGFKNYGDLPSPSMSAFDGFMCPLSYLFLFDMDDTFNAGSCRHGVREGRMLKAFRAANRRWFDKEDPELEALLVQMGDVWLSYTRPTLVPATAGVSADAPRVYQAVVPDELLDACVEAAFTIHTAMTKLLMLKHAIKTDMPETARAVFLQAGGIVDNRLPMNLRGAAAAAEKAEIHKRSRDGDKDDGRKERRRFGGEDRREKKHVADGNFWCFACQKELPKSDAGHRTSVEHLAAMKKRR